MTGRHRIEIEFDADIDGANLVLLEIDEAMRSLGEFDDINVVDIGMAPVVEDTPIFNGWLSLMSPPEPTT